MQDSTLKALCPNNAVVNPHVSLSESSLRDTPSLKLFEKSLRVRLELFALDAQIPLEHSLQTDLEVIQEQLELQQLQLVYLLNEIRMLHRLKAPDSKEGYSVFVESLE